MIYSKKQFATIITDVATFTDLQIIAAYVLHNAVAIIKEYGATGYNAIVFAIEEKERQLENITV